METINGGLFPCKGKKKISTENNEVKQGIVEYLLKLNIHKNINDLYASCIVVNNILIMDEFRFCAKVLRRLITPLKYDRGEYYLFKELFEIKEKGTDLTGKCTLYDIVPEHKIKILMSIFKSNKMLHIQKKQKEVSFVEYNGKLYKTIEECSKETGLTRYDISKNSVKKIIKSILYKAPYRDKIEMYNSITANCDYKREAVEEFFLSVKNNEVIIRKLMELHTPSLMTVSSYGSGTMPNKLVYFYSEAGRRYLKTKNDANLQTMKAIYRNLFFDDYYELDIQTCAPNILLQMDGGKYPIIEDYIKDKNKYREEVKKYGLTESSSKQFINSLFFGASPKSHQSTFRKNNEDSLIDELFENTLIESLMIEVATLFKSLPDKLKRQAERKDKKFILYNLYGKRKEFERWNSKRAISFMYQGVEASILDIMDGETNAVLLMHDAIITKSLPDIPNLISLIKEKTGYNVTFSHKKYDKDIFFKEIGYEQC